MNQEAINRFCRELIQDVNTEVLTSEEGAIPEEVFTGIAVDIMSENDIVQNVIIRSDMFIQPGEREQHKVNGYALSDNYDRLDLFVTLYKGKESPENVLKSEIDKATSWLLNYFRKSVYEDKYGNKYARKMSESAPLFGLTYDLGYNNEIRENLLKVKGYIVTDGIYEGTAPQNRTVNGIDFSFLVIDIRTLYDYSLNSRTSIDIDFEADHYFVPCIEVPVVNEDYQAYLAVLPGEALARMYEVYGDRLLQQNVRSFLQFNKKNKGMKDTIVSEPQMFLAYNNGLTVTAEAVETRSDPERKITYISRLTDLQIVNGGQTTASVYFAGKDKKAKADLSQVYVQMKLSVIKNRNNYSDIVSKISRYSNVQNAVKNADLSTNNACLVKFERISRKVNNPRIVDGVAPNWFFERVRGQYRNLEKKNCLTSSARKKFQLKYPKKLVVDKNLLANVVNVWEEVYDNRKLIIGPHTVVNGKDKSFDAFMNFNLPAEKEITNCFVEDTFAKCIVWNALRDLYGEKNRRMGELRNVVVPYAIGLFNLLTEGKLDLYRIWLNQEISVELSKVFYEMLQRLNAFIMDKSPSANYLEWGKKPECWCVIKNEEWNFDFTAIRNDFVSPDRIYNRVILKDTDETDPEAEQEMEILKNMPQAGWKLIMQYMYDKEVYKNETQKSVVHNLAFRGLTVKLRDSERKLAVEAIDYILDNKPELFGQLEQLENLPVQNQSENLPEITIGLVRAMVEWDRKNKKLEAWKFRVMQQVANGEKELDERMKYVFRSNYKYLSGRGFRYEGE